MPRIVIDARGAFFLSALSADGTTVPVYDDSNHGAALTLPASLDGGRTLWVTDGYSAVDATFTSGSWSRTDRLSFVNSTDIAVQLNSADMEQPGAATALPSTPFGRSLLTPTDAAAARGLLELVPRGQAVAYLGDSLMPNSTFNGVTAGVSGSTIFWAAILASMLGKPYSHLGAGVGGETSTQIAARISTVTGASPKPTHCFVHAGVNDLAAGETSATIITNLTTIINALLAAQITPIVLTMIPSSNVNTAAKLDNAARVNDWIMSLPTSKGVIAIDWRSAVVDWTSSTGAWTSGWTQDGVHPNDAGHAVIAQALAVKLASVFVTEPRRMVGDGNTTATGLLSPNPGLTGSSGTLGGSATGTAPTGWTVGTATYSAPVTSALTARTDGVGGNWLSLTPSGAQTGSGILLFYQNTAVGTAWNVGDTVWAEVEVYMPSAVTNLQQLSLQLDFWNGIGVTKDLSLTLAPSTVLVVPGSARPFVLRTAPTVVPASTARLQLSVIAVTSSGQINGTIYLGRPAIRKSI